MAKQMSAAELARYAAEMQRNLAGFEKALRDQVASFAEYASQDGLSDYGRGTLEGQRDAYKQALVFLHIWTGGEFGDAIQDGA